MFTYIMKEGYIINPPPMKTRLMNRKRKDVYCKYHYDYGHDSEDCFQLKKKIENPSRRLIHLEISQEKTPLGVMTLWGSQQQTPLGVSTL